MFRICLILRLLLVTLAVTQMGCAGGGSSTYGMSSVQGEGEGDGAAPVARDALTGNWEAPCVNMGSSGSGQMMITFGAGTFTAELSLFALPSCAGDVMALVDAQGPYAISTTNAKFKTATNLVWRAEGDVELTPQSDAAAVHMSETNQCGRGDWVPNQISAVDISSSCLYNQLGGLMQQSLFYKNDSTLYLGTSSAGLNLKVPFVKRLE